MITVQQILSSLQEYFTLHDGGLQYCTLTFFITFLIFYAVYIIVRNGRREAMLGYVVVFSIFYAYKANGWFMLLLPATTLISWWLTRIMQKLPDGGKRKTLATFTVIIVLSPLLYFKYTNFAIQTLNNIIESNFAPMTIFLPIGISFYTFQAISYVVDVYKRKFPGDTSLLEYTFFLTFFPLLMAGPITRPQTLIPQLKQNPPVDKELIYSGLFLIITGILKKGVIADYIAQYNNWIFDDPTGFSGFENLMGVLGYTIQIYCDFSGYSDLSIGIAALLGFRLLPNFNSPYQSLNLSEFWHRWHIALSTWFRDYLYIPLGGNRKGKIRTYLNNFITMLFAGWWHGASWMFIIWGGVHGVGLMIHKSNKPWLDKLGKGVVVSVVSWLVTFCYVAFAWIFFRASSVQNAVDIITRIGTDFSIDYFIPFINARPVWSVFVAVAFLVHLAVREKSFYRMQALFVRTPWIIKLLIFVVCVQLVINFRLESVQPFIYAQF